MSKEIGPEPPQFATWHRIVELAKQENEREPSRAIGALLEQVDLAEEHLVRGAAGMRVGGNNATDLALSAKGPLDLIGAGGPSGAGLEHAAMVERSRVALAVAVKGLAGILQDRGHPVHALGAEALPESAVEKA